jgi:NSS family neurotransmitter:Na+ symporter
MAPEAGDATSGEEDRDTWDTRLGYVLAMIGSAVGLGNLVRFPFVASQEGGAVFVGVYLVAVFLVGIPMLMGELMLGRRAGRNVVDAFGFLGGGRWSILGVFFVAFNVFVMSWFSVIGGWTLIYVAEGLNPAFWGDPAGFFFAETEGPKALAFHALFVAVTAGVVALGISDGIEPAVKVLLPVLGLLMVGLAVYSLTLEGAGAGVEFYLDPDLGAIDRDTFTAATGQALFSMSVGFGALVTYASYISEDANLSEDGVTVGLSDTAVALVAGFVIFPLLGVVGLLGSPVVQEGGLGVAFLALPNAFESLGGALGGALGMVFFGLLFVAALSSSISLMEVGTCWLDDRGVPRWKSALLLGLIMYGAGVVMALNRDILNLAGGTFTDLLLIGGTLVMALFLGHLYERRMDEDPVEEMDRGAEDLRLGRLAVTMIRYVLPLVLVVLFAVAVPDFVDELRTTLGVLP